MPNTIAKLPEAAYAALEGIAKRIAMATADQADHSAHQGGVSSNGNGSIEKRVADYLGKVQPSISGQNGHKTLMRAAAVPVRFGIDDPDSVFRLLRDHYNVRCEPPWSESELRHKAEEACKTEKRRDLAPGRGKAAATSLNGDGHHHGSKVNEGVGDPHRLARIFKDRHWTRNGVSTMIFYRGEFHQWTDSTYHPIAEYEVTAQLTRNIKAEFDRCNLVDVERWERNGEKGDNGKSSHAPVVHQVTRKLVGNVDQALNGMIVVGGDKEPPMWLVDDPPFPAEGVTSEACNIRPQPGTHPGRSWPRTATNARSCTSGIARSTPPPHPAPSTSSPNRTAAA